MAHLIAKYAKERENSLTLLLNFKKEEVPAINEQLDALKFGKYRIRQITNETTAKRSMLYISGGVYTITNVILVMDLLQQAISPSIITTVIYSDAEKIDNVLNDEAWIATMIRRDNKVFFQPFEIFVLILLSQYFLLLKFSNVTLER